MVNGGFVGLWICGLLSTADLGFHSLETPKNILQDDQGPMGNIFVCMNLNNPLTGADAWLEDAKRRSFAEGRPRGNLSCVLE